MPELPEVETVCRGLSTALTGARIVRLDQHRADLRLPLPANLSARVQGRQIRAIKRRAKYILIALAGAETLLIHLGMSGRMVIGHDSTTRDKHDHLIFHMDNGLSVRFNDPRRFGLCDLARDEDLPQHKFLAHLGVEPLGDGLTPAVFGAALHGKKTSIKDALMDQRRVVGIGNIYASEALFHARITPQRAAGSLRKAEIAQLIPAIQQVLHAAIAAGGSSLRDYRQADGELGYFQHQFAVYDRAGQACPACNCDIAKTGGIQRITQGGRSTYFCPTRQHDAE